jgi:hypothetical protein
MTTPQPGTLLDLMSRHGYALEVHTILHIFGSVCHAVAAMHHHNPPLAHRCGAGRNRPRARVSVCRDGGCCSRL